MRIAVLGSGGQLGHELCARLPGDVLPLTRAQADLTDAEQTWSTLTELQPDVVINCAAYNLVDRAESEPDAAFAANAHGVQELASTCNGLGAALVHFSTDYVFGLDQARCTPYLESDTPGAVSVYGRSKLAGEHFVRSICPKHYVIRTCGLYSLWGSGGKGGNFVETMLRVAGQGKPLRVVDDQVCTPSYAVDVAQAVIPLIATKRYGLYHVTNSGSCTWFELARTIFELAGVQADLTPISSGEYGAAARRPAYSVLASTKLPPLRSWQQALAAYLDERRRRPERGASAP